MLSLHLSLCEILVEAFNTTLRYCNTTRTNELKYATHLVQTGKHIHYILGDTSFLHYRVGRVHLYEVCIVSAHNARNLLVGQYLGSGEFQQGALHNKNLVVYKAVGLQDIDALLYLLDKHLYLLDKHLCHLLLAIAGDGILVHAWGA